MNRIARWLYGAIVLTGFGVLVASPFIALADIVGLI